MIRYLSGILVCLCFASFSWATNDYRDLNYDVYVKLDTHDDSGCLYDTGEDYVYDIYLKPKTKLTVFDSALPLGIQQYPLEPALLGQVGYHAPLCDDPEPVVTCLTFQNLALTTALSESTLATYSKIQSVNGDWNGDGKEDLFANGYASTTGFGCPIQIKNNGLSTLPAFSISTSSSISSNSMLANATQLFARNLDGIVGDELLVRMDESSTPPAVSVKSDSNGKLFTPNSLIAPYIPEPDLLSGFIDPSAVLPKVTGATTGSHSVGIDGSASYSIPLALPTGAGGIQPSLQFSYGSNGGNGNMGFGWQLNAVSRIHRCGKTEKQDGAFTFVAFSLDDQLCLDGQRLILVSGDHGQGGAEYRLENEVFIKVVAAGDGDANMPASFTVYSPDGSVMEYDIPIGTNGVNTGAPSYNKVTEWLVSHVEDRWQNSRDYTYLENTTDGYYVLDRIDYGGNSTATTEHTNHVQFRYGTRGNGYYGYMLGTKLSNPKVLTSVEIYEGTQKLRFYALTYDVAPHNNVVYLQSVTECSAANVCLYPTRFEWEEPGSEFKSTSTQWFTEGTANLYSDSTVGKHEHWADMNGDGRVDRVWKPSNKTGIWVALSTGSGFSTATEWLEKTGDYNLFSQHGVREIFSDANGDGLPDFIWQPSDEDDNLYVALNTGSSLQTATIWLEGTSSPRIYFSVGAETYGRHEAFVDINADGLVDKVWRPNGEQDYYVALNTGSSFSTPTMWYDDVSTPKSYAYEGIRESWVDVNGDGYPDKVWVPTTSGGVANTDEIYVALNNNSNSSFDAAVKWLDKDDIGIEVLSSWAQWEGYADLNNDGLADRYWMPKNMTPKAMYVALSDGTKFLPPTIWLRDYSAANKDIHSVGGRTEYFMDVNDDGYPDRVWRPADDRQSIFVALSTGSAFGEPLEWLSEAALEGDCDCKVSSYSDAHETFVDVNGDGLPDRAWIPSDHSNYIHVSLNEAKPSSELVKVTNGFGHETLFTYAPLTDSSVYSKHAGLTVTYPLNSNRKPFVQDARRVVAKVETSNGIGGYASTSYDYEGLRYGMVNKESLGFARIKVTNDETGMFDVTTYNQGNVSPKLSAQSADEDEQGLIAETDTHSGGGTDYVLSHTVNTWDVTGLTDAEEGYEEQIGTRYERKLLTTDITKRGLDNEVLYIENNSYTYDEDGRINVQTTVTKDPGNNTVKTTTIDNDYVDFTDGRWLKGLTSKMTVTDDVTAAAYPAADSYNPDAVSRVSKWIYSETTGVLEAEQIWNGAETVMLMETLYSNYDDFGHPLTVEVDSADADIRDTATVYDSSGRFVIESTNALDQTAFTEYYTGFGSGEYPGLVKTVMGANGVVTRYYYDSFGRVTETIADEGGVELSSTRDFVLCDGGCPPEHAAYAIYMETEGSGISWSYVDVLGREIRKASQGFDGNYIMVDVEYNDKGQVSRSSEPYYEYGTPVWNEMTYDLRDRVISITHADGRVDTQSYSGDFNGTTKVTATETVVRDVGSSPHTNESRTEQKNALGQVLQVIDNATNVVKYRYDSAGRLVKTIDAGSNEVTLTYDEFGRKTGMSDPDKGSWSYGYNGLGELVLQTSAEGDKTCIAYDLLGRMVLRVDQYGGDLAEARNDCDNADGMDPITTPVFSHWEYDYVEEIEPEVFNYRGVGKLYRTYVGSDYSSSTEYREERLYDESGRLTDVSKTIKTEDYHYETSYDAYSRPEELTYPYPQGDTTEPLVVKHEYNGLGFLTEIRNADNNDLFYEVVDMNERGQITEEIFGNGVVTLRDYDDAGRANTIYTYGLSDIQDIDVDFDLVGNLTARTDTVQNYTETFTYDNLNRLTGSSANFNYDESGSSDIRTMSIAYDVLGNITSKSGVGDYKYGSACTSVTISSVTGVAAGPHAQCAITSTGLKNTLYTYDANGNMIAGDGRAITYATFDLPTQIIKGSATSNISYGPDRNRYYREDIVSSVTTATVQVDGLYERITQTGEDTQEKHYLGNFAVITFTARTASDPGTSTTRYLHTDHLGSLTAITDESGDLAELYNYDAWGNRRSFTGGTALSGWSNHVTTKGYTGHEMFDDVGLVHMNGRIYDPLIARFLQADPIIQDTSDLQAFNRYSYVQNRPLSLTDPSGFMSLGDAFDKIKDVYKVIDPVGYAVMKAQAKAHQALARETGRLFIKVPELQMAVSAALVCMGQGYALALFNTAVAGSVTYQSGGQFGDILESSAFAFTTSAVAAGVGGDGFWAGGLAGIGGIEGFAASVTFAGAMSKAQGGKFFDGRQFVKGLAIGLAVQGVMQSDWFKAAMAENVPPQKVEGLRFFRKDIDLAADANKYGHWWGEVGPVSANESYGWYMLRRAISLAETVLGTEGDLNGATDFPGGQAGPAIWVDPDHGQRQGVNIFEVYSTKSSAEIISAFRNYARSYKGNWSWPIGQNCHSFQQDFIRQHNLILKQVEWNGVD